MKYPTSHGTKNNIKVLSCLNLQPASHEIAKFIPDLIITKPHS